ncbi:MAG: hypothetical protein HOK28_11050 [Deltaproteobacteria bacterium]|nr:hypothetical protein [Deltaproteobacteria bacterium]
MVMLTAASRATHAQENLFSAENLHRAYLDCRRRKRSSSSALQFELRQFREIFSLEHALQAKTYRPGRSIAFVLSSPKYREVFAAHFRDRVVHHLFVREIEPYWEKRFIGQSFACRPQKGVHAAVDYLQRQLQKVSQGKRRQAYYLQLDIENFFGTVHKPLLRTMVLDGLKKQYHVPRNSLPLQCRMLHRFQEMQWLTHVLLNHRPETDVLRQSSPKLWKAIPAHKSLFHTSPEQGLPIGNLTSQFFANIYLNKLDQFIKHELKAKHYMRYVDDFVLLSASRAELQHWHHAIDDFVQSKLKLKLKKKAKVLSGISSGVNFLGYIVRPTHKYVRRRTLGSITKKLQRIQEQCVEQDQQSLCLSFDPVLLEKLRAMLASYSGHWKHAGWRQDLAALRAKFLFLGYYFYCDKEKNGQLTCRWRAKRSFTSFKAQVGFFRKQYPFAKLRIQLGRGYQVFDALNTLDSQAELTVQQTDFRGSSPRERLPWKLRLPPDAFSRYAGFKDEGIKYD